MLDTLARHPVVHNTELISIRHQMALVHVFLPLSPNCLIAVYNQRNDHNSVKSTMAPLCTKATNQNERIIDRCLFPQQTLERTISSSLTCSFYKHHILSTRLFGFRKGSSAADIYLIMDCRWSDALNDGYHT